MPVAVAAVAAVLACTALVSSSSTLAPPTTLRSSPAVPSASAAPPPPSAGAPLVRARTGWREALGEAAGSVPAGTSVFDAGIPAIANLDSALRAAVRRAAAEAADAGVEFVVDSGWRSAAYQEHLLREAVLKYGSAAEASRWVATPDRSAHVSGDAIDLGPASAAAWLSEHGAAYGLCRVYANEPWHYELRPEAVAHGCPATYADPTHDPRMQRR